MNQQQLSRTSLIWQLLAIVFAVLPHLSHLPLWVPGMILTCLGWRFMVFLGRWSFPNRYLRVALVLVAAVGILSSYKMGGGISSTVALLVVAFGLKTLEMYHQRDALIVIYVAYLVSATAFLFSQSIAMALYVFFALSVCTTALLTVNYQNPTPLLQPFKQTLYYIAPAVPLMVVLFLVIPRIGPLWEMGLDRSSAKTGLSEEMSPGDITQLTRSAEVAFRVQFEGTPPAQQQLYWRALVMNDFDGRRWYNSHRNQQSPAEVLPMVSGPGERLHYELILEATDNVYIPVLEHIADIPSGLTRTTEMTVLARNSQLQRTQYALSAWVNNHYPEPRDILSFKRQLLLPEGNPRARQQAREWWQEAQDQQAYINKILQHYNSAFVYTLTPRSLGKESVDQFLFDTQQGFCEHFSSATAFLLRAVGIPARIVTGYQGGEWNPYENYLLVRQYDAHAWVEYWTEDKGWTRLDPTASVAPQRVEQPSDQVFGEQKQFLVDNPFFSAAILSKGLLSELRLRLEALNYGWHHWVLGYHLQQQSVLQQLLGQVTPLRVALFLLVPFVLVIAASFILIRKRGAVRLDPCDEAIQRLSKQLGKYQLQRLPGETVQQFCGRIGNERVELSKLLTQIAYLYEKIRYAECDSKEHRRLFYSLIQQCLRTL